MRKINLKKKADNLLTPILKKMHPKCLLCGAPTQVAHHHVHKSQSMVLRYDLDNLIPLCNACHLRLHYNESYWASKIVQIKGLEWFEGLERKKHKLVKANAQYFTENIERLQNLMINLMKNS